MNENLKEIILERNLIENLRMVNSEMLRADILIHKGPKSFHTAPSTSFIKKVIVSGGEPYTYMFSGSRRLWK
jgi:hypothetical protein